MTMTETQTETYSTHSLPPAGWYPDPDGGASVRYWDGAHWTDHYAHPQPAARPVYGVRSRKQSSSLSTLGSILALVAPILGFLVGLVMLARDEGDAVTVVVLSVISGAVWTLVFFLLTSVPVV